MLGIQLALTACCALQAPTAHRACAARRAAVLRCAADDVVSPFSGDGAGTAAGGATASEFTIPNVDAVLEEVRPYLISDGGNVKVVGVDPSDMSVQLQLQGACGSCPSSTVTMKMGIERVLRENWPTLGEVVDVGGGEPLEPELSIESAHEALEPILPAIAGLGGSVRIVSAAERTVTIEYNGPEKVKMGIELALKDSPLIDTVVFS